LRARCRSPPKQIDRKPAAEPDAPRLGRLRRSGGVDGDGDPGPGSVDVAAQHVAVQLLQLDRRIHAQLVEEVLARAGVLFQRLGSPSVHIERTHQVGHERLGQRIGVQHSRQSVRDVTGPSESQFRVRPLGEDPQQLLAEALLDSGHPLARLGHTPYRQLLLHASDYVA
jgi:hypothetical protein